MAVFFGKVTELNKGLSKQKNEVLDVIIEEGLSPKGINFVKFEVYQHKLFLFKDVKVNDIVKISFNITGNNHFGKIFTNLHINLVEILESSSASKLEDVELPDNKEFSFEEFE